jgi:hypothetical protein
MAQLLKTRPGDAVLRIIRDHDRLRLRVGVLSPGDQTFAHKGRVVLVLDQRVSKDLALRHLDLREASTGPRLRLKSS